MERAFNVTSHAPYVGVYKCAASGKLSRLSSLFSSSISLSASQVFSSIVKDASGVSDVSGLSSFSEDK